MPFRLCLLHINNQCILRKNLNYISELFNLSISDLIDGNVRHDFSPIDDWRVNIINELIDNDH